MKTPPEVGRRRNEGSRSGSLRFGRADGVPWGTRTLDLLLRRQLLYPAELKAHQASDGNRTHITSLEGWNSTTELHSQRGSERPESTHRTGLSYHRRNALSSTFPEFLFLYASFFVCFPSGTRSDRDSPERKEADQPDAKKNDEKISNIDKNILTNISTRGIMPVKPGKRDSSGSAFHQGAFI